MNIWSYLMTGLGTSMAFNAVAMVFLSLQRSQRLQAQQHIHTLRTRCESSESGHKQSKSEMARVRTELAAHLEKYEGVRQKLSEAGMDKTYYQPVFLLGPRGVGKTSLVTRWEVVWEDFSPAPSIDLRRADVLVREIESVETVPHYVDPSIMTAVHAQIKVRVWDVAGELHGQRDVETAIRDETRRLLQDARRDLGVVIVCMFDASECVLPALALNTRRYYTAELFAHLRTLAFQGDVKIERIVMVFNKIDRLLAAVPKPMTDQEIVQMCRTRVCRDFPEFEGLCSADRVSAVTTVLDSTSDETLVGAPVVLREAARGILASFGVTVSTPPGRV
jgi:hypothetical protein